MPLHDENRAPSNASPPDAVNQFACVAPKSAEGQLRSVLWDILGGMGAESVESAAQRVVRERDVARLERDAEGMKAENLKASIRQMMAERDSGSASVTAVVDAARAVYRAWDEERSYVNKMLTLGRAVRAFPEACRHIRRLEAEGHAVECADCHATLTNDGWSAPCAPAPADETPTLGEFPTPDSLSAQPCGACGADDPKIPRGWYGQRTACLNGRACCARQAERPARPPFGEDEKAETRWAEPNASVTCNCGHPEADHFVEVVCNHCDATCRTEDPIEAKRAAPSSSPAPDEVIVLRTVLDEVIKAANAVRREAYGPSKALRELDAVLASATLFTSATPKEKP